jgi:DNA repair photolyase
VQQLLKVGIIPEVRLDPIIPFVNDDTDEVRKVLSAIAGFGLREAPISFMHLRPGVAAQIRRDAPEDARRIVLGCFPSQRTAAEVRFDHLPANQALAGLRRLQRLGRQQGIRLFACRCQNPGLPSGRCAIEPKELPPRAYQQPLFSDE